MFRNWRHCLVQRNRPSSLCFRRVGRAWLLVEGLEDRNLLSFLQSVQVGPPGERLNTLGDFTNAGKLDIVTDHSILLGNGDGSFQDPNPLGSAGRAVGDFNGDGNLDLVDVLGFYPEAVIRVLPGHGDGTFGDPILTPTGISISDFEQFSYAVGDFDGDGIPDLAVATSSRYVYASVHVYLGKGDGTFQEAGAYPLGQRPGSVVVGDFRHNGIIDIAVANLFDNNVSVLLGNGHGAFQSPVNYPVGRFPHSLAVADFNGDGIPDLVVTNDTTPGGPSVVSVLLGNGDGTFRTPIDSSAGFQATVLAAGDFDNRGMSDLVVSNYDGILVLVSNGDGTFRAGQSLRTVSPNDLAVGDFHGNGRLDLAATQRTTAGYQAAFLFTNVEDGAAAPAHGSKDPAQAAAANAAMLNQMTEHAPASMESSSWTARQTIFAHAAVHPSQLDPYRRPAATVLDRFFESNTHNFEQKSCSIFSSRGFIDDAIVLGFGNFRSMSGDNGMGQCGL